MNDDEALIAPVSPDLVWFSGSDAIRFLNDLISQEIEQLDHGAVTRSFLLTPQGKLGHLFWVLRGDGEVGLLTDEGRGAELAATLRRYRIRVDVEIEVSEAPRWVVMGRYGVEPGRWSGTRDSLAADVSWMTRDRTLVVGERPPLGSMTLDEYERLRIEAGEPRTGVDVTEATIPQETGLVPLSISFTKGCFLGQELVARLDSRGGRVNRHLRILRFAGDAPSPGSEVVRDEEVVGEITSSADGVALASLKRGVEPGDVVASNGSEAVVEAVPAG